MLKTGPIRLLAIVCCTLHSWAGAAASAELGERFAIERMLAQTGAGGGIVSYVGRPDTDDLAKLSVNYRFVHVLEGDARCADQLDKQLYERGLRGRVSVMRWRESHLPYADDLVNLLIADRADGMADEEILRVVAPLGMAYIQREGRWLKLVKQWPVDIDEWTHYLHGSDNNAVARDTRVGPPQTLQWTAAPVWTRNHGNQGYRPQGRIQGSLPTD